MSHPKNVLPHAQGAKPAAGRQPGALSRQGVAQPKTAPAAPPVYSPQPVPKVLQRKAAAGPTAPAGQTPRRPVAPPVYRPEPRRVVQPKAATAQGPKQPASPTVYRPQPAPRVLQTKSALPPSAAESRAKHSPAAPPPFVPRRTGPSAPALQPKMAAPRGPASRQVIQLTTEVNATAGQTLVKDCYGGKLGGTVFQWPSKFAVDIVDNKVVVTIRIKAAIDPTQFQTVWAKAVENQWSNRFAVQAGGKNYPIVVNLVQVNSGEHYAVKVSNSGSVFGSGARGHFGTEDMTTWGAHDTFNISHEVGHMLGNVDEYGVVKNTAGKTRDFLKKPSNTIMGVSTNNPVARHYRQIKHAAINEMISLNLIGMFDTAKVIPDPSSRLNLTTSFTLPSITNAPKLRHVSNNNSGPSISTSEKPEWMTKKLNSVSSGIDISPTITNITSPSSSSSLTLQSPEVTEMKKLLRQAKKRAAEHGSGFGKVIVKYIESTIEDDRAARERGDELPSRRFYLSSVKQFVRDLETLIEEEEDRGYHYRPSQVMREKYPDIF